MKILKAPREFDLESLPAGLSKKGIEDHYNVLYRGYVNKYNEIQEALEKVDKTGNTTYSEYRELKREEAFCANAIRLHEAYFEGLGGDGLCSGTIMEWIDQDFGSYENWVNDLRGAGMSARGWVILAYDVTDGLLHNYTSDIHSDGIWAAVPLLVLDVYEHAYYFDFAADRKSYIEGWLQNIDWQQVNSLLSQSGLDQARKAA